MPTIYRLNDQPILPDPREADHPDGLLAVGGDLEAVRLLRSYSAGIFPWFNQEDPYLWWSPHRRAVFFPQTERFTTRTLRALRRSAFELRLDTQFRNVVLACQASPRKGQKGTWITVEVEEA